MGHTRILDTATMQTLQSYRHPPKKGRDSILEEELEGPRQEEDHDLLHDMMQDIKVDLEPVAEDAKHIKAEPGTGSPQKPVKLINYEDFMRTCEVLRTPLHAHTTITTLEAILLTHQYMIHSNLNHSAADNMLKLMGALLPMNHSLPSSYKGFVKVCSWSVWQCSNNNIP